MLELSRNLRQNPSSLKSYYVVTVDTTVPVFDCAGGPGGVTTVPAFVCTEEPVGVTTVTVLVCAGGPVGDTAVLELVCAGGPDERNDINLFSKSNAPPLDEIVCSTTQFFDNKTCIAIKFHVTAKF